MALQSSKSSRNYKRQISIRSGGASRLTYFPFTIFQVTPTPSVPASNWRNVQVYGPGLVYNTAFSNLSNAGTPLNILVPESTSAFYIYAKITVSITLSAHWNISTAEVAGSTIASPAEATSIGWPWYPQVATDSPTDDNYAKRFVLIGRCDTSTDALKQLTITQYVYSTIFVPLPSFKLNGSCYSLG